MKIISAAQAINTMYINGLLASYSDITTLVVFGGFGVINGDIKGVRVGKGQAACIVFVIVSIFLLF